VLRIEEKAGFDDSLGASARRFLTRALACLAEPEQKILCYEKKLFIMK
jgi:hypothetical protein